MKPLFKDGILSVELHKPEISVLERAKAIGQALVMLHQPEGAELVKAVDAILEAQK